MTNQAPIKEHKNKYDLEERTTRFAENVIAFCKKISQNPITNLLINQLVRAGTSIGANYAEAEDAESKQDFKHKIAISKKEARETKYWLRLIATTIPETKEQAKILWQEAKELNLIFNAIIKSSNNKL